MIFSGSTGLSGRVVDNVFLYILLICIFLLGLITFLMIYFVIRYRREKHPRPAEIEGSAWLEITWTVIPTLIVLTMFYYGLTGFQFLRKAPEGSMVVKVMARQWSWLFQYENGAKDLELRVPVGKPIKLILTSEDVLPHSELNRMPFQGWKRIYGSNLLKPGHLTSCVHNTAAWSTPVCSPRSSSCLKRTS
jgi:cytochrome c oxidase subunit 2